MKKMFCVSNLEVRSWRTVAKDFSQQALSYVTDIPTYVPFIFNVYVQAVVVDKRQVHLKSAIELITAF